MIHRLFIILATVAVVLTHQSAFATDAGGLSWLFQRTGYTTATSSQTALAMGDSKSWPVVFSLSSGSTQAYSLTPVLNFATNTYWNQIGTNILTTNIVNGGGVLSAESSSDGRVGVSIAGIGGIIGSAIVGRRSTGFANPISNVQGLAFDQAGTLVTASVDTLAGSGITNSNLYNLNLYTVQSIATSPFGSIGVLTSSNGLLSYYEKSPLTGWSSATIASGTLYGGDLAIDTIGRPFVAYSTSLSGGGMGVAASYFDIMSGQWKSSTFNVPAMSSSVLPTIAADGIGGIGVAWMSSVSGTQSLMYAYKNGVKDWAIHTVTSFSVSSGTSFNTLLAQKRVGLDFDAQNWPVISFLGSNGFSADIWIAYDPVVVPEPSSLVLAAVGLLAARFAVRRTRR